MYECANTEQTRQDANIMWLLGANFNMMKKENSTSILLILHATPEPYLPHLTIKLTTKAHLISILHTPTLILFGYFVC